MCLLSQHEWVYYGYGGAWTWAQFRNHWLRDLCCKSIPKPCGSGVENWRRDFGVAAIDTGLAAAGIAGAITVGIGVVAIGAGVVAIGYGIGKIAGWW